MAYHKEELLKRLIDTDPDFKKTYDSHKECEKRVVKLEKKPILTAEEAVEKKRLKKEKLSLKDEMEKIMARHREKV